MKKYFALFLVAGLSLGCACHSHHDHDMCCGDGKMNCCKGDQKMSCCDKHEKHESEGECESCKEKKKMAEESEGGVKEEKITALRVPAAVREAWSRDFPNQAATKFEKETDTDGTVRYEITYKNASGEKEEVLYTADGKRVQEK